MSRRFQLCLSVAALLPAALLLASLAAPPAAAEETLRIGGTGAALGMLRHLGAGFMREHRSVTVEIPKSLGSSGGIKALTAGVLDIAVSSRHLKDAERSASLRESGLGRTPLAVITSRTDWREGLTVQALVGYFGLRQRQWPDGHPLYIVLRPQSETDTEILSTMLPGMEDALHEAWATSEIPLAFSDQDNLDFAERLSGSLAVSALSAVITERRSVTPLALEGVMPTVDNLKTGAYKLSRHFYLVTRDKAAPLVEAFTAYVRSPAGRKILLGAGVLPGIQ